MGVQTWNANALISWNMQTKGTEWLAWKVKVGDYSISAPTLPSIDPWQLRVYSAVKRCTCSCVSWQRSDYFFGVNLMLWTQSANRGSCWKISDAWAKPWLSWSPYIRLLVRLDVFFRRPAMSPLRPLMSVPENHVWKPKGTSLALKRLFSYRAFIK